MPIPLVVCDDKRSHLPNPSSITSTMACVSNLTGEQRFIEHAQTFLRRCGAAQETLPVCGLGADVGLKVSVLEQHFFITLTDNSRPGGSRTRPDTSGLVRLRSSCSVRTFLPELMLMFSPRHDVPARIAALKMDFLQQLLSCVYLLWFKRVVSFPRCCPLLM